MSEEAKQIMGEIPEKYFEYWRKKFPHLLINTWNVCRDNPVTPTMLEEIQTIIINRVSSTTEETLPRENRLKVFFFPTGL